MPTKIIRAAALATVLALLFTAPAAAAARCGSPVGGGEWPSYGHDPANTRAQPAEHSLGPAQAAGVAPAWVFSTASTGDGSGFESTPTVDGGCVFVGSAGGVAYALDARSGHVVWQRRLDVPSPGYGGAIVGAPAVSGPSVIYLANENDAPYAIALDRATGAVAWRSAPFVTSPPTPYLGYYTNSSPVAANGYVLAGYSAPEGDRAGTGGFALIDAQTGDVVKVTPTIPLVDQAQGYAGGGLWSTPAYDPASKYAYWGSGNPYSKTKQHPNTNAILKVDVDPSRSTFGQIVGSYQGNVDQYAKTLQALSQTPACAASDNANVPYPLNDPVCGQIDLDFGAAANLFTTSGGTELVGELQKSGVYHAAHADTMKPAWTALVGASCFVCNAASTAFDGSSIEGVATPGGTMFSLARDSGAIQWLAPIADGLHYQGTSYADGVAWTVDSNGNLDAFDAAGGRPLLYRPVSADAHAPVTNSTSSGVAIAEHTVFTAVGGLNNANTQTAGYVLAYRAP